MNNLVIKDMGVKIELNGTITTIIGPSNSGKTYLAKKICNMIKNDDIYIDEVSIKEYDVNFLKNNVVVVLDDNEYNQEYVAEELYFYLDKLGYRIDESTRIMDNLAKHFKIKSILSSRIDSLNIKDKSLVKILSLLIVNPKILVVDNLLSYLDTKTINLLLKYIKDRNISFINITNDSEQLLFSDNVVVLNNMKAVLCAPIESVIDGNSILPYMGIKLPFIVDLSHNLMLYGIVDKIYSDNRKLVDKIWK